MPTKFAVCEHKEHKLDTKLNQQKKWKGDCRKSDSTWSTSDLWRIKISISYQSAMYLSVQLLVHLWHRAPLSSTPFTAATKKNRAKIVDHPSQFCSTRCIRPWHALFFLCVLRTRNSRSHQHHLNFASSQIEILALQTDVVRSLNRILTLRSFLAWRCDFHPTSFADKDHRFTSTERFFNSDFRSSELISFTST